MDYGFDTHLRKGMKYFSADANDSVDYWSGDFCVHIVLYLFLVELKSM